MKREEAIEWLRDRFGVDRGVELALHALSDPPPAPTAAEQAQPVQINLTQLAIAMRADARAVFRADGPECSQDVRDAIEYCCGLLCGIQARADYAKMHDATPVPEQAQPAGRTEQLHAFLDAAAGEGLVLGNVDAADLYITLFPERYNAGG